MHNKQISQVLFTSIMLSSGGVVLAASPQSAIFNVTASVAATCTIAATSVAFGVYDPVTANAAAELTNGGGAVTVTCTKGATPVIGLGVGQNSTGSLRRMKGANATSPDFLGYELYQPPSTVANTACTFPGTTVWNSSNTLATAVAPSSDARSYSICGSVAAGQDVAVDTYSDIVTASVSF
jgi:spore coat protein U-like protein